MFARVAPAALVALAVYLFTKIRRARFEQYRKLPQLKPSLIWGHLKAVNEFMARARPGCHSGKLLAACDGIH